MNYATARPFTKRLKRSLEGCRADMSLRLCLFEEGYCIDLFGFLIPLPFLDRWIREPHDLMESWGIYYSDRACWFTWGRNYKAFHMPWELHHVRCEVMRPDGSWVKKVPSYSNEQPDGRWTGVYPYTYTLKSGGVQKRTAKVYLERHILRWRCLKWLPIFPKGRASIWVEFNDEVGERTGSWKGGTIGCGYTMKAGESPEDTLRRMEREREFN